MCILNEMNVKFIEVSSNWIRPYFTEDFRLLAFHSVHGLSHSLLLLAFKRRSNKSSWPDMDRDITKWARMYPRCQIVRIRRHSISGVGNFKGWSFQHVHIDIVGLLTITSDGYKYCLPMTDRLDGPKSCLFEISQRRL